MKLSEKARKLKNEYQNKWKKKNPDKVRKYIADYWERQAEKLENSSLDQAIKSSATDSTQQISVATDNKRCIVCGNEFQSKRADARFCSSTCRSRYNRNH